ncbi:MAG: hypothetical protein NTY53_12470 [Kiritimatiellaeota bacterium]|nr:hypothetical protein [Kiritimatiellota bacterium]
MRVIGFIGQETTVEGPLRREHGGRVFLDVGEERFQRGTAEFFNARFKHFAPETAAGEIVILVEKNFLLLDLRTVPARLAVLAAHHQRHFFAGDRAKQFLDSGAHLLELGFDFAALRHGKSVEFLLVGGERSEHRLPCGRGSREFPLQFVAVATVEFFEQDAAEFHRALEDVGADAAHAHRREQDQQRGGQQRDGEHAHARERAVEQLTWAEAEHISATSGACWRSCAR